MRDVPNQPAPVVIPGDDQRGNPPGDGHESVRGLPDRPSGRAGAIEQVAGVDHRVHLAPKDGSQRRIEGCEVWDFCEETTR